MTKKTVAEMLKLLASKAAEKRGGNEAENISGMNDVEIVASEVLDFAKRGGEVTASLGQLGCGCKVVGMKFGSRHISLDGGDAEYLGQCLDRSRFMVENVEQSRAIFGLATKVKLVASIVRLRAHCGLGHAEMDGEMEMIEALCKYVNDISQSEPAKTAKLEAVEAAIKGTDMSGVLAKYGVITDADAVADDHVSEIADVVLSTAIDDGEGLGYMTYRDGVLVSGDDVVTSNQIAVVGYIGGVGVPIMVAGYGGAMAKLADRVEAKLVEQDKYVKALALPLTSMRLSAKHMATPPSNAEGYNTVTSAMITEMQEIIGPEVMLGILKEKAEKRAAKKDASGNTKEAKLPTFH